MGYYTRFKIELVVPKDGGSVDDFTAALHAHDDYFSTTVKGFNDSDSMKWYDFEDHVARAMLSSGATAVTLSGKGEENGDRWDREFYVVDGEVGCRLFQYELLRPAKATSTTKIKIGG